MNNIVIKNLNNITPYEVDTNLAQSEKTRLLYKYINPTKYTLHGFVNRTNDVVLETRYHNVRDRKGRFACVKQSR